MRRVNHGFSSVFIRENLYSAYAAGTAATDMKNPFCNPQKVSYPLQQVAF